LELLSHITIFHTEIADMFKIYIHTRLHMHSSNDTLAGTIKPKCKYIFHTATILLLHYTKKQQMTQQKFHDLLLDIISQPK
jgi:hypothetical protein